MLVLAALALLAYGVWKANPLVTFGTRDEVASERAGRMIVYVASLVLLLAVAMLVARIGVVVALVVAEPGVVCPLLVALAPRSAYALIAFVVLAPASTLALAARLYRWKEGSNGRAWGIGSGGGGG